MVVPAPVADDEEAYPALLDEALLDRGLTSVTHHHSRWHATVKEVLHQTEPWIRDHHPDVVVLNVGFVDCQARVLPTWLYRHSITWLPGLSRASQRYRRHAIPTLRLLVRHWQRLTVGRVGLPFSRVPPGPFAHAVKRIVKQALRDHRSLVLLLDVDGPGPALSRWQPGIASRIDAYNDLLSVIAQSFDDPRVVLLRTSRTVAEDQAALLPDGIHRSAEGHRRMAGAIADAVVANAGLLGLEVEGPRLT
jgi:lysophospholipase L1-like esterase